MHQLQILFALPSRKIGVPMNALERSLMLEAILRFITIYLNRFALFLSPIVCAYLSNFIASEWINPQYVWYVSRETIILQLALQKGY